MSASNSYAQAAPKLEGVGILQTIDLAKVSKWNAPYEFRGQALPRMRAVMVVGGSSIVEQ